MRVALPAYLVAMLACGGTVTEADQGRTELRVIHLNQEGSSLRAAFDGEESLELGELEVGQSSEYVELDTDVATIELIVGESRASLDLDLDEGRYTVVAVGDATNLEAIIFEDDDGNLDSSSVRLRAIHAAPSVGQVDILDVASDGSVAELATNLDVGDFSTAIDVPATATTIGVDLDNDARAELYFELPPLDAGAVANIYVAQSETAIIAIAQQTGTTPIAAAQASLRVVHASRDTGEIDIEAGGERITSGLRFAESSPAISLRAGVHYFEALVASQTIAELPSVALAPASYTLVIYGDSEPTSTETALRAELIRDAEPADDGDIRFQVFHAAPTIEQGDLYALNELGGVGSQLVADLAFGGFGTTPELLRAPYDVGFEANSSGLVIADFSLPSLTVSAANVFIIQDSADEVYLLGQLAGDNIALVCERATLPPCVIP